MPGSVVDLLLYYVVMMLHCLSNVIIVTRKPGPCAQISIGDDEIADAEMGSPRVATKPRVSVSIFSEQDWKALESEILSVPMRMHIQVICTILKVPVPAARHGK